MKAKLIKIQNFFSGKAVDPLTFKPPYFLKFRSSTGFIVFTICLAIFTDILFYGLIVPVIPFSLTVQSGVPEDKVQEWTAILLACYSATLFVCSPLAGFYADRTTSRRLPLLFGLFALAGSTVLLCLGKTVALLVVGRLLQGLSAAIVWSVGLALLADTCGRNIGFAMGYVAIAMSVGLLISPVIGGAVYAAAGYYAVYYVAFAIIGVDIVLRLVLIEKKVAKQWITDEESTLVTGEGGVAPVGNASDSEKAGGRTDQPLKDIERAPASPHDKVGADSRENGSPTLAGNEGETQRVESSSVTQEAGNAKVHPYLELIKSKRVLAALFGSVIQAGIMFSFDTVVPLFVKDTFHWSSTAAGLIFITIMVPGFGAPLVGMLADRYGARWPSLGGFIATVPLLVCLRFVTENTIQQKVLLSALLVLLGATLTFTNTPLMAEITYAIEEKEARRPGMWGEKGVYGIGYGLFTTSFALGGTAGSLLSGYVVDAQGWGTMTWALAIWMASGIPVVALWVGGKPSKKQELERQQQETGNGSRREESESRRGAA
ncbi:major facilitator superfamily domain-containing protein [Coniochaeta sp. 2T2.1]|nr:major facilitator superfamily domain-containing protein [Coniochaeta sp. 2T2.1]